MKGNSSSSSQQSHQQQLQQQHQHQKYGEPPELLNLKSNCSSTTSTTIHHQSNQLQQLPHSQEQVLLEHSQYGQIQQCGTLKGHRGILLSPQQAQQQHTAMPMSSRTNGGVGFTLPNNQTLPKPPPPPRTFSNVSFTLPHKNSSTSHNQLSAFDELKV